MNLPQQNNLSVSSGLSLIEILISIAIIVLILGIAISERESFSRSINLNNVSHEIALAVRQAQTYGVSSRGSDIGDDIDDFAYGIEFDVDTPQRFILFRDDNGNDRYNSNGDTLIEEYLLPERMEIADICTTVNANGSCASGQRNDALIMFTRPNPDAHFFTTNGSSLSRDQVVVAVEESSGARAAITIHHTGYIDVD